MSLHENCESDNETESIISCNSGNVISINSSNSDNSDNSSVNSSVKSHEYQNLESDYCFTYNNGVIPVTLEEVNMFENNCVSIASLSNYYDKKDDSQFSLLYLPKISITYNSFVKMFFNCPGKNFTPFILNKIWNSIRGLNLVNEFLKIFEKKTELNRNDLSIVSKIKLYKEFSFSSITTKASKIFALNLNELNSTLTSGQYREDGKINVGINFLLYSEILQVGINITLPILLSNIPNTLYVNSNDSVVFDF